jgi:hypothetical protein
MIEVSFNGGESRQRFAFTQASVYKDASAFGFEQRKVARTAGSKYRNAQTDGTSPGQRNTSETVKIMAERKCRVNAEERLLRKIALSDKLR